MFVMASTRTFGDWDWDHLQGWLSATTLERLAACPIPKNSFGDDFSGWRWKDNRCFTVGSAYDYLVVGGTRQRNSQWKLIWSLKVPHRVRVFMWLVAHRKLLTNEERVCRHLAISAAYSICGEGLRILIISSGVALRHELYGCRFLGMHILVVVSLSSRLRHGCKIIYHRQLVDKVGFGLGNEVLYLVLATVEVTMFHGFLCRVLRTRRGACLLEDIG
ncbi:hypothetical protein V6N12_063193 [Hibiscus sabdariffa]|uniref:Reverse transcriptase zinc-binding domain-containing protein n=1 Tax=Hibiscus sabdariffa TaxID=183260 RepID=A0ABR2FB05_9ROSI